MTTITQSHPQSEFSLLWHRDGHTEKLIAGGLSANEANIRIQDLSEKHGQPILADWIVNESAEDNCGYYYVVEDLPEGTED